MCCVGITRASQCMTMHAAVRSMAALPCGLLCRSWTEVVARSDECRARRPPAVAVDANLLLPPSPQVFIRACKKRKGSRVDTCHALHPLDAWPAGCEGGGIQGPTPRGPAGRETGCEADLGFKKSPIQTISFTFLGRLRGLGSIRSAAVLTAFHYVSDYLCLCMSS